MPSTIPIPNAITTHDLFGNSYQVSTDRLTWRPSAYAVVVNHGNILLVKHGNSYSLPGGGVELGESLETTVLREVKEEAGLEVANSQLLTATSTFFTWQDLDDNTLEHYQESYRRAGMKSTR